MSRLKFVAVALFGLALLAGPGAMIEAQAAGKPAKGQFELPTTKLTIATGTGERHVFTVEVADDDKEREVGLMHRKYLPTLWGMLFQFGEPRVVSMWMKDTYIPLDMLFIDAEGTITKIARQTEPFSLQPIASIGRVTAVLEVAGGTCNRLMIAEGDKVLHPYFGTADTIPE